MMHELTEPTSTISTFLEGTLFGAVAREQSILCEFPLQTAHLLVFGLASHVVNMVYCSQFKHYRPLPSGMYVSSEQSNSASKSPFYDAVKGGVDDEISKWNKEIKTARAKALATIKSNRQDIEELDDGDMKKEEATRSTFEMFITNTTPEALEARAAVQDGIFSIASTEKTILETMFGGLYADKNKASSGNMELPLSGFVGEKPKVLRVTRDGINCRASGAITVISQPGTIEMILRASGNSGLGQRFLFLLDPKMTLEEHEAIWSMDKPKDSPYTKTLDSVFRKIIRKAKQMIRDGKSLQIEDRQTLKFAKESEDFLTEYTRECKRRILNNSDVFSNELISGYLQKSDMQIMKLATNLHVVEHLINENEVPPVIEHKYVEIAWMTVFSLMRGVPKIGEMMGLIGSDTLTDLIVAYLQGKGKRNEKAIYNAVRQREQFRAIDPRNRKQEFEDALRHGVATGQILQHGGLDAQRQPIFTYSALK